MLGYPLGLPMKLTINAGISNNDNFSFFYTSLDSFSGNSGAPVFDLSTHRVIGILVSGAVDFEFNGSCYKESVCRDSSCFKEKVIRIEEIKNSL